MGLTEALVFADRSLFRLINTGLANPLFDGLMPFLREPMHWAPLYLFFFAFAILNFRKTGAWWCLFLLVTVPLCDMTGTYVFKHGVQRLRPCNEPDFFFQVRLLADRCSSGFSFVSNHAANHFGIATFFFLTTRGWLGRWALLAFAWSLSIGFAQIYIGIHYPLDVLGGAGVGVGWGLLTASIFNKRHRITIFESEPTLSS